MQSKASTPEQYIKHLPEERREEIAKLRKLIHDNIPKGYKEVMLYGMICYVIPLDDYPDTYNNQPLLYVGLASQKKYISLYLTNVYSDDDTGNWFVEEFKKSGKKLNMGKSCLRFKTIDEIPLDLIEKTIAKTTPHEFIKMYEASRSK